MVSLEIPEKSKPSVFSLLCEGFSEYLITHCELHIFFFMCKKITPTVTAPRDGAMTFILAVSTDAVSQCVSCMPARF